jgi:meso-butanediol dehydrogenase/(S,S)-butanediol dehydrogenase/diacetyl reductase
MQRVVIITGGGTGIGAATARRLAAAGWHVVVAGRRSEPISAVASEVRGRALVADMSDEHEIEQVVSRVVDEYGRLDGLVLNAGVMLPGRVGDLAVEDWRTTLAINLTGPFILVRAALPLLLDSHGVVVAVGSIGATVTGPASAAYGASKAALVRLVRSIAADYGPDGVRANAVNPGWIRSEMADTEMDALGRVHGIDREAAYALVTQHAPARRPASADEAAAAVAWLMSSEASYVNGAVLTVDGGTSTVSAGALAFGMAPDE